MNLLVLRCSNFERSLRFYKALGLRFQRFRFSGSVIAGLVCCFVGGLIDWASAARGASNKAARYGKARFMA